LIRIRQVSISKYRGTLWFTASLLHLILFYCLFVQILCNVRDHKSRKRPDFARFKLTMCVFAMTFVLF